MSRPGGGVLLVCAGLLAGVASAQAEPTATDTCTQVVIELPDVAILHGDKGKVTASARTNLAPGSYTIRYRDEDDTFVIAPWASTDVVVDIWLPLPDPALALYKAYVASMSEPVPLRVVGGNARPAAGHATPTAPGALSTSETMQLIQAAGASAAEQGWARMMHSQAGQVHQAITAADVEQTLAEHKKQIGMADAPARTTREAVASPALRASWEDLHAWERALWRDYLDRYGDTADVTSASRTDLHLYNDVRLGMALRIAPRYMRPGAREAAALLFNDPVFIGSTVIGISVYLALWVAPEPVFSKAAAVITTLGLVSLAGFTAAEITALAHAWMRLKAASASARTLAELERAGEQFGKSLGGSALRILVALATMLGGKAVSGKPTGAVPATVVASPRGTAAIAGAGRAGWGLEVVNGSMLVIVPGSMAASVVHMGGGPGGTRQGYGGTSGKAGGKTHPAKSVGKTRAVKASGKTHAVKSGGKARAEKAGGKARTEHSEGKAHAGNAGGKPAAQAEPGQWQRVNEHMSARSARYQEQISGKPVGEAYVVRGVRFDGYKNGVLVDAPDVLIEAKGQGYKNFVKGGKFQDWFSKGRTQLLEQAQRQSRAARGIPIEWHVAEAEVIPVLKSLFRDRDISGIKVIHTPLKP